MKSTRKTFDYVLKTSRIENDEMISIFPQQELDICGSEDPQTEQIDCTIAETVNSDLESRLRHFLDVQSILFGAKEKLRDVKFKDVMKEIEAFFQCAEEKRTSFSDLCKKRSKDTLARFETQFKSGQEHLQSCFLDREVSMRNSVEQRRTCLFDLAQESFEAQFNLPPIVAHLLKSTTAEDGVMNIMQARIETLFDIADRIVQNIEGHLGRTPSLPSPLAHRVLVDDAWPLAATTPQIMPPPSPLEWGHIDASADFDQSIVR